jgi:hypothetical protein
LVHYARTSYERKWERESKWDQNSGARKFGIIAHNFPSKRIPPPFHPPHSSANHQPPSPSFHLHLHLRLQFHLHLHLHLHLSNDILRRSTFLFSTCPHTDSRASKTSTNSKISVVLFENETKLTAGIGAADVAKLKASGICTVYAVQATTKRNLSKIKGLSDAKVDKIKEAVCKIFVSPTRLCCLDIGLTSDSRQTF